MADDEGRHTRQNSKSDRRVDDRLADSKPKGGASVGKKAEKGEAMKEKLKEEPLLLSYRFVVLVSRRAKESKRKHPKGQASISLFTSSLPAKPTQQSPSRKACSRARTHPPHTTRAACKRNDRPPARIGLVGHIGWLQLSLGLCIHRAMPTSQTA